MTQLHWRPLTHCSFIRAAYRAAGEPVNRRCPIRCGGARHVVNAALAHGGSRAAETLVRGMAETGLALARSRERPCEPRAPSSRPASVFAPTSRAQPPARAVAHSREAEFWAPRGTCTSTRRRFPGDTLRLVVRLEMPTSSPIPRCLAKPSSSDSTSLPTFRDYVCIARSMPENRALRRPAISRSF